MLSRIRKNLLLKRTQQKLAIVLRICRRPGAILVLMQDNPDPDALASAAALRDIIYLQLKKRATIGYGGMCGRAENRAMTRLLKIDARRITVSDFNEFKTICLVDTQPYSGNNIVLGWVPPNIVIDHHLPSQRRMWSAEFTDIRPDYGATSTIFYEYFLAAGLEPDSNLATALFYGVQSDTQELGREANEVDIEAYRDLFLIADKKKLARIRRAPVPAMYFKMLHDSLANCVIAGNAVISFIPACRSGDMVAEVADLLIRLEGAESAVCYGVCGERIFLSIRVSHVKSNAANLVHHIVRDIGFGGGHRRMAGGQIPITGDREETLERVRNRILKVFAQDATPVPLEQFGGGVGGARSREKKQ